jgi:glycolate oxidase
VARGAGTGLSGGANAVDGCLIVDVSRMRDVEIDAQNMTCTVQPGIVNNDLKAQVADHRLWYPPDPASAQWSTIGGNVATNAGGLCCLKYGVTRDYVLGLRAVMGGDAGYGTPVALGRKTTKGVAGLDLASLMVGSEGVLGVITEITLRLRPAIPGTPRTVVGHFDDLIAAGTAVATVTTAGLVPSALELLDRTCLDAVEEWKHLDIETTTGALLMARVDTPGEAGDREAAAVVDCFDAAGASWADRSTDDAEAEALFEARRLAYPAVERLGPVLTEDMCVPRSKLPDMLARVGEVATSNSIRIATIAHAGDGNLHPLLLTPPGDDAARGRAELAFEQLMDAAIALGGTVTGEHGVGLLKKVGMERELDANALALMRSVKRCLDPLDLFNPGKVL